MIDSDFINWIADRMVHHHSENEDFDYIIRLRKIATEAKEREDLQALGQVVKLEYFREGGKWYGSGTYRTHQVNLFDIWAEVQDMLDNRKLPDLIEGHDAYCIAVDVAQHPHRHPHLIFPMTITSKPISPSEATLLGEGSRDLTAGQIVARELPDADSSGMDRERRAL